MQELTIDNLMTRNVATVAPDSSVAEVLSLMRENRYSCVVVADGCKPLGIITERDAVSLLAKELNGEHLGNAKSRDVMSSPPITLNENATLFEALVIARGRKIRHLIVVNVVGEISGILTQSDLVDAYFHVLENQTEIFERAVLQRTRDLLEANEQLRAMSLEDALMGIGNRRAMEVDLEHTHSAALRYGRSYSVALMDIDFFKQYNDHYGHNSGDEVLRKVGQYFVQEVRKCDRIYRYGGEEILLLLPETPFDGAHLLAERLGGGLFELGIEHAKSPLNTLSISGGVGCIDSDGDAPQKTSWKDVVAEADRALYVAKKSGRNQIGR